MTQPLVTAVAPRWEVGLAGTLSRSSRVRVVRRCADVAELLGVVAAGVGRVAVVSSDLRGLDRSVVDALGDQDVLVLGVFGSLHPQTIKGVLVPSRSAVSTFAPDHCSL